jgi:hypothetical protein
MNSVLAMALRHFMLEGMRNIIPAFALCLIAGCASDLRVPIQPYKVDGATLARVTVNDRRTPGVAASKRDAAFGTPMGNITFDPPEAQLVKSVLEAELTKALRAKGAQATRDFSCDLVEFGVNTNTTPLYWDVVGRVHVIVKSGGTEMPLLGTHTVRTFVWPGEDIIRTVVDESLRQVAAGVPRAAGAL